MTTNEGDLQCRRCNQWGWACNEFTSPYTGLCRGCDQDERAHRKRWGIQSEDSLPPLPRLELPPLPPIEHQAPPALTHRQWLTGHVAQGMLASGGHSWGPAHFAEQVEKFVAAVIAKQGGSK